MKRKTPRESTCSINAKKCENKHFPVPYFISYSTYTLSSSSREE